MDLGLIFLVVVAGVALIAFAGMGDPKKRKSRSDADGSPLFGGDRDADASDGGGDGGGD